MKNIFIINRFIKNNNILNLSINRNVRIKSNNFNFNLRKFNSKPFLFSSIIGENNNSNNNVNEEIELLHPILWKRAESIVSEYNEIKNKLNKSFNTNDATRIGELEPIYENIKKYENLTNELNELKLMMNDSSLENEAKLEFSDCVKSINTVLLELKNDLLPKNDFSNSACIMEIRPGVGGSEASIFAKDLLTMYTNYCNRKNWKYKILSLNKSSNGSGITEAILEITSLNSFDSLTYEAGVHRVQRVPETEAKGRVHTSTAAVIVLPLSKQSEKLLTRSFSSTELRIETMRASGPGGQHVNKTESAVRLTHIPTGISVHMRDSRSQHENKEKAFMVLNARLDAYEREIKERQEKEIRKSQVSTTDRGDKIRTYNFPQDRITDHRCSYSTHGIDELLNGRGLDEIINAVRKWRQETQLKELLNEKKD